MSKYQQKSLVYPDDSIRFIEKETGKEVWGSREYKDGQYTGNIGLENGDIIKAQRNLESSLA